MSSQGKYDIVIIGGGPAGFSLAISVLQEANVSVLILENKAADAERIGESCPPDLVYLLSRLKLYEAFKADEHLASPGFASLWGRDAVGYNDSIVNPLGPSWCLDRKKFAQMLTTKAEQLGAEVRWNTRFLEAQPLSGKQGGYQLQIKDTLKQENSSISSRFVVDASGTKASFAKSLGIKKNITDRLVAFIRFAKMTSGKISSRIQIEARPEGWWYQAPLPEARIVSMLVTEKTHLPQSLAERKSFFEKEWSTLSLLHNTKSPIELTDQQYLTWPILSGILPLIEGTDWVASRKLLHHFGKVENYRENQFTEEVRKAFAQYQKNRAYVYTLEQRWGKESFWSNRYAV